MLIFTAKFSKKKALAIVAALAVVLIAIILIAARKDQIAQTASDSPGEGIKTGQDIIDYLTSLGWQVSDEPMEVQEIVIPREFTEIYESYNELQKESGYDLSDYCGIKATRYTFEILNYPGEQEDIVADVIVAKGSVIGGDIQSIRLDGFMLPLTEKTAD